MLYTYTGCIFIFLHLEIINEPDFKRCGHCTEATPTTRPEIDNVEGGASPNVSIVSLIENFVPGHKIPNVSLVETYRSEYMGEDCSNCFTYRDL